jgi:hypothetical protein
MDWWRAEYCAEYGIDWWRRCCAEYGIDALVLFTHLCVCVERDGCISVRSVGASVGVCDDRCLRICLHAF